MKKRPVHSRGSLVRTADTGFYDAHGPAELTAGNGLSVGCRVGREGLEAETLPEGVSNLALVSQQAHRVGAGPGGPARRAGSG